MPKSIIFSLDYDGCADILFDDILKQYPRERDHTRQQTSVRFTRGIQ